ncbi:hypothetical protein B0H14DRAFT_1529675 [Mycena olivaceomarginata]|nr:hypothetical protein B0H14DRAFT_1529675 [Mycena olivaceomarginata]
MGLFGGAFRTYALKSGDDGSFTSRQIFAHSNPHTGAGRGSTATPPYHWHLYQTETFDVNSGVLCYILDGKTGKLQAGETVTIPPRHWHTFWSDPASGADLDVNITVRGGPNPGFDETFRSQFLRLPVVLHHAESRPESHPDADVHVLCGCHTRTATELGAICELCPGELARMARRFSRANIQPLHRRNWFELTSHHLREKLS